MDGQNDESDFIERCPTNILQAKNSIVYSTTVNIDILHTRVK